MRNRQRILQSLETLYREDFDKARAAGNQERMEKLELDYQRDQIYLEVLLDLRDVLLAPEPGGGEQEGVTSILEKAQKLRNLTRLR